MSAIGERLKAERKRLGYNQEDFAAIAGVTRRPCVEWETGNTSPTAVQLSAFAAIGVDVLYVITGERAPVVATLAPDEAALLDNYRNSPEDARKALKATSAALAKHDSGREAC